MRRKTFFLLLSVSLLSYGFCLAENRAPFQGEINSDNINLRSDSTVSSAVICSLNKNDRVEVVSELYEWYKIRLPKKAPAYIKKTLVELLQNAGTGNQYQAAKVLKNRINVRLSPDESSPILGKIDKDELTNIVEDKGEWYRIEPINNSFGWVHKKFVSEVIPPPPPVKTEPVLSEDTQLVSPEPAGKEPQEEKIVLEGIVKPYGKFFKRIFTHTCTTLDKAIFLLKADKEMLMPFNYQRVRVTGKKLELSEQKYPVIEVKTIEALN